MKTNKGIHLLGGKDFIKVLLTGTVVCGIALLFNSEVGGELFSKVARMDTQMRVEQIDKHMKLVEQEIETLRKRFWLEALEPIWHYRPRYWLGKTEDVEDKEQVLPHFLANFVNATDVTTYKRRIYIDLGVKDFDSSVCWMMQNYPVKFDLVYGFECASDLSNMLASKDKISRCISGTAAETRGYQVEEVLQTFKFFHNYVGVEEIVETIPATKGLSQFLKKVGIVENDFVVLKMDVEGLEYDLLSRIMEDGTHRLLDEVFVEIHYNHPEMHKFGWASFAQSRNDAQALFIKARDMGMFIHPWP